MNLMTNDDIHILYMMNVDKKKQVKNIIKYKILWYLKINTYNIIIINIFYCIKYIY